MRTNGTQITCSNLSGADTRSNLHGVYDREGQDPGPLRSTSASAFQVSYFYLLPIFLLISYGNPQKQVTKRPILTWMAFLNKGTVSRREYHIPLIVLQIPFLIKIKIFIPATLLTNVCSFLFFRGRCFGYNSLFFSFGGVTLVRKIYGQLILFCF